MVANGIGITLLPQLAVDYGILSGIDNVEVRAFQGKPVKRSIYLLWRKHSPRETEYQQLAKYLQPGAQQARS